MTQIHVVLGVVMVLSSAVAGLWGAWRWYRVEPSAAFWKLLRLSQACILLVALHGGLLLLLGRDVEGLHLLYGVLPLAVSFIGEQLRIAAAETVLDARGLPGAAAVAHEFGWPSILQTAGGSRHLVAKLVNRGGFGEASRLALGPCR